MPRLRILLAPSAYYPHVGGIEELTRQLALTFQARGHSPVVLTNQWPRDLPEDEVLDGIRVVRLPFPLPAARPVAAARFLAAAPFALLRLFALLRTVRPDVVHVIGAGPQSLYLGAVSHASGARLVFTAQGELTFDANDVFRHSIALRVALRRILRRADAVSACSTYVLGELVEFGKIASQPLVIPNGVNPADFAEARAASNTRPYVLAVGRLVPQKGFDVLIDAFADERLESYELLIAGEGPEHARLATAASIRGIHNRVQFLGPIGRRQLPDLLVGADAFVLASRGEPFGIALLEAMAAGTPCVATKAGGVTDFARDEENALLVPPNEARSLSDALHRLLTNEDLRLRLASGGRTTSRLLTWDSIADRYERLYANPAAGVASETR